MLQPGIQPALRTFRAGLRQKQERLKERLDKNLNLKKICRALDSDPATRGTGIVFIDAEQTAVVLRSFKAEKPFSLVLREPPKGMSLADFSNELKTSKRDGKLFSEVFNAGLSCGGMVLSWVVVFGGMTSISITGPAGVAATYFGYTAALSSLAQCGNAVNRVHLEMTNPERLDRLDSEEWYQNVSNALDIISIGSAAMASANTIKMVQILRKTSAKSLTQILKGLNRAERKRLTQEIYRLSYPGVNNRALKQMLSSGELVTRYSHAEIAKALTLQIKDLLNGGIGVVGSTASGVIHGVAIGIYEELSPNER